MEGSPLCQQITQHYLPLNTPIKNHPNIINTANWTLNGIFMFLLSLFEKWK